MSTLLEITLNTETGLDKHSFLFIYQFERLHARAPELPPSALTMKFNISIIRFSVDRRSSEN